MAAPMEDSALLSPSVADGNFVTHTPHNGSRKLAHSSGGKRRCAASWRSCQFELGTIEGAETRSQESSAKMGTACAESCRSPCCLTICDVLVNPFIVAPLTLLYWWGTWMLVNELTLISGLHLGIFGLLFLGIGIIGEMVGLACQNHMAKWFSVRSVAGRYIIAPVYLYLASFLSVSHWVGVWYTLDGYVEINITNNLSIAAGSLILMVGLRTFRSARAPPVSSDIDKAPDVYYASVRWPESKVPFLIDVAFTVAIINSVNVVYWRCVWELQDLLILPDDVELSAVASLLGGLGLTYICYILQYPVDALSRWSRKQDGHCAMLCMLLTDMLFTFLTVMAAINVWRGLWMNFHLHLWPSQLYYSYWIGHSVGYLGLSVIGGATNLPVRGVSTDATHDNQSLSINFFRSHFPNSQSVGITKVQSAPVPQANTVVACV